MIFSFIAFIFLEIGCELFWVVRWENGVPNYGWILVDEMFNDNILAHRLMVNSNWWLLTNKNCGNVQMNASLGTKDWMVRGQFKTAYMSKFFLWNSWCIACAKWKKLSARLWIAGLKDMYISRHSHVDWTESFELNLFGAFLCNYIVD